MELANKSDEAGGDPPKIVVERMYFIDKLRTGLTLLVVIHHCFWVVAAGWFPFYRPWEINTPTRIFSYMILSGDQAYFMGLFFFMSGLVFGPSLAKKGFWTFLKDRFIRLMIPAIVYDLVLFPLLFCFVQATWYSQEYEVTFSAMWSYYYGILGSIIFRGNQMWFTVTLFALNCLSVLVLSVSSRCKTYVLTRNQSNSEPLSTKRIILVLFVLSSASIVLNFVLRVPFPNGYPWYPVVGNVGFIGQYALAFAAGMIATCSNFIQNNLRKDILPITLPISFVSYMVFQTCQTYCIDQVMGSLGFYGFTIVNTFFEQIFAVFWSYSLLVCFKSFFNSQPSYWISKLIAAAYATYIIHQWIVIPLAVGFAYTNLPAIVVILLLCLIAPPVSWSAGLGLKLIPGSHRIL